MVLFLTLFIAGIAGRHRRGRRRHALGELGVLVGGFTHAVTVQPEYPQFPDPERSGKLVIELGCSTSGRQCTWADRKRSVAGGHRRRVLREIEILAVEDAQREVDRSGPRSAAESRVVVSAGTGVALSRSLRPNGPPDVFQQGLADQVEPRQVWWRARPAVEGPVRGPGDPRDASPLWICA